MVSLTTQRRSWEKKSETAVPDVPAAWRLTYGAEARRPTNIRYENSYHQEKTESGDDSPFGENKVPSSPGLTQGIR